MRRPRPFVLALAGLVVGCNAILGITEGTPLVDAGSSDSALDTGDGAADVTTEADTSPSSDGADTADASDGACTGGDAGAPGDLEGCPCKAGDSRSCAKGMVGGKSACKAGTQSCSGGVYGACTGGVGPSAGELCFDDIDNDCNGAVDEHCSCGDGANLCRDVTGTILAGGDHFLLNPPSPAAGSSFDVYLVTTLSPYTNVSVQTATGYCYAPAATCDLGAGCVGWHGIKQTLKAGAPDYSGAGPQTVTCWMGDVSPPCNTAPPRKPSFSFTIK